MSRSAANVLTLFLFALKYFIINTISVYITLMTSI